MGYARIKPSAPPTDGRIQGDTTLRPSWCLHPKRVLMCCCRLRRQSSSKRIQHALSVLQWFVGNRAQMCQFTGASARSLVPNDVRIFVICLIASVSCVGPSAVQKHPDPLLTVLRTSRIPAVGACCFPAISPPTLAADRSVSPLPPNYRPPCNRLLPPTTGGQPVWWSYTSPAGTSSPIGSC